MITLNNLMERVSIMANTIKSQFIFVESDDETTDSFYVYKNNKDITIQVCHYAYPDIYSVNKWNEEDQSSTMTPCKSLKEAQQKAINL